jgi:hypothetical protein
MLRKPKHWTYEYAEAFQDRSVVEAYRHRPPYPTEVFDILVGLINTELQCPGLSWKLVAVSATSHDISSTMSSGLIQSTVPCR